MRLALPLAALFACSSTLGQGQGDPGAPDAAVGDAAAIREPAAVGDAAMGEASAGEAGQADSALSDSGSNDSSQGDGGANQNMVVWQDNVQTEPNWQNWGPGFFPACGWGGQSISCFGPDSAGASLGRVAAPAGGGFAVRHYVNPANGGGRAQYSMASWTNPAFGAQVAKGEVWVEWEVFFPVVPTSVGPGAWLSIMDFHSHGPNGEEWWATDGALMFASQALGGTPADAGKLRMRDYTNTKFSNISPNVLPANTWVKLQVHYIWSTSEVPITLYVDGVQAMQMSAVTKHPVHTQLEFMVKLYGGNVSSGVWSPDPIVYYSRNVKIGSALIQ